MSQRKSLINRKRTLNSQLTRFGTYLDGLVNKEVRDITQLSLRLKNVKECLATFNTTLDELEALDEGGDIEAKHAEYELERTEFENLYFERISRAEDLLKLDGVNSKVLQGQANSELQVRLPQLNVPSFTGQYEDWLPFKELFLAIIANNPSLTNLHKLYFLRQALKNGTAEKLVDSIELTANNYTEAWQILEDRFQNERVIVEGHIRSLFDQPKIEKESSTALRKLLDNTLVHLKALASLKQPVQTWDALLIHIVTSKLDYNTCKEWQKEAPPRKMPTFKELSEFLQRRSQILENMVVSKSVKVYQSQKQTRFQENKGLQRSSSYVVNQQASTTNDKMKCPMCNGAHNLYFCSAFLKLKPQARIEKAKHMQLCINCFRPGHWVRQCLVPAGCKICHQRHNTLLHYKPSGDIKQQQISQPQPEPPTTQAEPTEQESKPQAEFSVNHTLNSKQYKQVILSTALVKVADKGDSFVECRALLDPGSSVNIMTQSLCRKLNLPQTESNTVITGVGGVTSNSISFVNTKIKSRATNFSSNLDFIVLQKITQHLPGSIIDTSQWRLPKGIFLADPEFNKPSGIDLLIGAEIFFELMCVGQFKLGDDLPVLQKTLLGWIVSGKVINSDLSNHNNIHLCHLTINDIHNQLEKFWTVEELNYNDNTRPELHGEDMLCETIFNETISKSNEGRYIVDLPLKSNIGSLGSSHEIALHRFYSLEKRLEKNQELKERYTNFMKEYENLNHMEAVDDAILKEQTFYTASLRCKKRKHHNQVRVV